MNIKTYGTPVIPMTMMVEPSEPFMAVLSIDDETVPDKIESATRELSDDGVTIEVQSG
jgi:hypothetical protein